jgi:glucose-6-phosphate-specific signal transduction histidine kinase
MDNNWYKYFNYGSLIFAVILVILLIMDAVPKTWYIPLLVIMILTFIIRIIARFYFMKQSKKQN